MSNLTGGQIQEVMDGLLYSALEPIVQHTDAFNLQLAYMVHLVISNKKRRPYSCQKQDALSNLVWALHAQNRETKFACIKALKLERNFVYMFVQKFQKAFYVPYMQHYKAMFEGDKLAKVKLTNMSTSLGASSRSDLYQAVTISRRYLPEFMSYFDSVVQDFLRYCTQQAKISLNSSNGRNYDFKDLKQNFLRNVIIAVNKYDCSRGALATYVQWWIMNARTSGASEHEYSIAYIVPQTKRRDIADGHSAEVNFSISLDRQSNEDDEENLHDKLGLTEELDREVDNSRQAQRISLLAKSVDPYGLARLVMDLPEVFSGNEIRQMKSVNTSTD